MQGFHQRLLPLQERANYLYTELFDLLFIIFYTGFLLIVTKAVNPKLQKFVFLIAVFDTLETASIVLGLAQVVQFENLFYLPFATTVKWLSFAAVILGLGFSLFFSLLKRRSLRS